MEKERNYARFYALLKQSPYADKEELVYQYTLGRTKSLKETTRQEYEAMCQDMERVLDYDNRREQERKALRKARSGVLHQLQLYGIDTTDWGVIDAFCKNPRIAGKTFRKLTIEELNSANTKIRVIIKKQNKWKK